MLEKVGYRENYELLRELFPGRATVTTVEAAAAKLRNFIRDLHEHGFIGSDKACRYRQGLDMAMKRSKRYDAD